MLVLSVVLCIRLSSIVGGMLMDVDRGCSSGWSGLVLRLLLVADLAKYEMLAGSLASLVPVAFSS